MHNALSVCKRIERQAKSFDGESVKYFQLKRIFSPLTGGIKSIRNMQKSKRYGMILIITANNFFPQPESTAYKIPAANIITFNMAECTDSDVIKAKEIKDISMPPEVLPIDCASRRFCRKTPMNIFVLIVKEQTRQEVFAM